MTATEICTVLLSLFLVVHCGQTGRYEPNWESLDARPLPQWYDEAKLGIFIHWGVFSVPSFGSEWFWEYWNHLKLKDYVEFMQKNYRPDFTYADFAQDFTGEFFDADKWMDMFAASGAKYIVFVSKHCEGFCNWHSNASFNWNSVAAGPKMDIVAKLAEAAKAKPELRFGLYHSLYEWFHPLYLQEKANNWSTTRFVDEKIMPELYELINTFKPEVLFSDGDWEAPASYWKSTEFLAWLYNDSPVKDTIVTNDRWGKGVTCHHGGYYTCGDRYNPGTLQNHKWENAMTLDKKSWGFRRNADLSEYLTMEELLETFAQTVSCGGNMLMNVGPTKYGIINPIFEERLRNMGKWLSVNGEAIYASKPWVYQNDTVTPRVWYTKKGDNVYGIILSWPTGDTLELGGPTPTEKTTVDLLGYSPSFTYQKRPGGGIIISIPPIPFNKMPCQWAWVIRFQALENLH